MATATHEVRNQPPPARGPRRLALDRALGEGLDREGAGSRTDEVDAVGRRVGEPRWIRAGALANAHEPVLHTHDRFGHRIDEVEYHPAYHELLTQAVADGLAGGPWADDGVAPHVTRAAKFSLWTQVEAGHGCPVSMTYSIVPALRALPELSATWEPLLTSRTYDPTPAPVADQAGRPGRHGHDREAGRLRRAGQHHPGRAHRCPRPGRGVRASSATSGSARRP